MSNYKGKVLLIVNTASKCKFTPQFDDLQKLYEQYREYGFEILGFPCNQFGEQEPGSNEEAASYCQINYGVKFPVFSKIEVNGSQASPLFEYLKKEAPFQGFDESNINAKLLKMMISEKNPEWLVGDSIKWNFTKFLVNQEGEVLRRYEPSEEPADITNDIARLVQA
ncbi:glutathione peroxidase [Paenibacillus sp. PvR098]|nr:glutathione peroxidase [Paenibacillus sp. PvP091]MBP1172012.1 glutathione peroxidase [Paenibacillus sp. PvR098]MBP2438393.1 glutathione peroxidase [Paenibacillus sp. PvP052]